MSARLVLALQVFNLQKKAVIHRESKSRTAEKWSLGIISAWVGRMAIPQPCSYSMRFEARF
ncbi:hypothetical protein GCM10007868_08930 [Gluconobacter frateurii]|nr:hypothetical protein GCM10007868_08930 [Gluconobacter frateurii]